AALFFTGLVSAQNQQAPSVSQVLVYSGVSSPKIASGNSQVSLSNAVPNVFAGKGDVLNGAPLDNPSTFTPNGGIALVSGVLNQSIATALSVIPISSPASGMIAKVDPLTGGELPASSTLGPIFTERAETIGKGHFYIGFSHQDYHFTSFNGKSLNGLTVLYPGGDKTSLSLGSTAVSTYPVTYNLGLDVRFSQDIAFITYGVTNRVDVSIGLPEVHAAVAARTYNGISWDGGGLAGQSINGNPNCWCATTLAPATPLLQQPVVGSSSMSKTGFGDLILRAKGTVLESPGKVLALGVDVRLPTGDAANYLGAGAASVKPFAAVSFYSKPINNFLVLSPHATLGWQFVGKSVLGGTLTPTQQSVTTATGPVAYFGAPFLVAKDFLPDVLSWSVGTEVALGKHNTFTADVLGNQIGIIHGMLDTVTNNSAQGFAPCGPTTVATCATSMQQVPGLVSAGRREVGEYSGAFGFKARIAGNLVAMFNVLVRFDNNSLVSRFSPLYGIGYSFGK
ncbi:MAG TPA: hypothetical protein VGL72_21955, partial [Bryobacteraceae bacterium]